MWNLRVWRDCPKSGESDVGWCYSVAYDGHVKYVSTGWTCEDSARNAGQAYIDQKKR